MRKTFLMMAITSLVASSSFAQSNTGGGVTMSTDPAKAAAVEQHAQELKSHQTTAAQTPPATNHSAKRTSARTHAKPTTTAAKPAPKK